MKKTFIIPLVLCQFFLFGCGSTTSSSVISSSNSETSLSQEKPSSVSNQSALTSQGSSSISQSQVSINIPGVSSSSESSVGSSTSSSETNSNVTSPLHQFLTTVAAENESKAISMSYHMGDNINYYKDAEINLNFNFYKEGYLAQGTNYTDSYYIDNVLLYSGIKGDTYYQIVKNTKENGELDSSSTNIAKRYKIANQVSDEESQISTLDANKYASTYEVAGEFASYLNEYFIGSDIDSFSSNDKYIVKAHKIVDTFYYTFEMEVGYDNQNFANHYKLLVNQYVKATMCNDDNTLKDDAIAKGTILKEYTLTSGERSNLTNEINVDDYYTSSYSVVGTYYEKSAYRKINNAHAKMAVGYSIRFTDFEMESYLPETALDDKHISFVSSSNTAVIDTDPDDSTKLKALSEGKSTLIFKTKFGLETSIEIDVCKIEPKEMSIVSNGTVKVGERIALDVDVVPDTSSKEVIWNVNDESLATIECEANVYYLKGLTAGNVTLTAKAKQDESIVASKVITITSDDNLADSLAGTWINAYSSGTIKFTLTLAKDKTFNFVDDYRGAAAKIGCKGNWELTDELDKDYVIEETEGKCAEALADSVVIKCSNVEVTQNVDKDYVIDIHFAYNKSTGVLVYHVLSYSGSGTYLSKGELTKTI